jgi:5-methylcytosine-specific restriction protein A
MPYKPPTNKINKLKIPENRPNSYRRGYDSSWKIVRETQLQDFPLCADCLKEKKYTPAYEVHHITKLADRPDLRDVSSNLMSLCKSCHSKRTAAGE